MVTLEKSYPVIWLAALLLSWSVVCNAEFTASVDRTIVNQHDTVELTLRSDKQQFGAEPDLSPLHELFTVLGRSQRSQFQSVNGKTQSWTDWIITLRPKRSGYVVIPPISLKGEKTKPITLDVKNAGSQTTGKNVSPVFIEASLDKETVYVQEQTVLTIYIYHSVALYDDSRITPLNIPNAISQQLGNVKNYETILNGQRYGVFELKYAIFPQESGDLLIPSLKFTSTTATGRRSSFGVFSRPVGTPVVEESPEIKLTVKPPPTGSKGHWLPAKKLTLEENWSADTQHLKVGDSITRTIQINAEGLTAAQLPPLTMPELKGVKLYPDQSQTKDSPTTLGVVGLRKESTALVPTQAGTIELPEIRYRWFNTTTQQSEEAILPAKQITIAALPTTGTQQIKPIPAEKPNNQSTVITAPTPASVTTPQAESTSTIWRWLTLLFAVLWLITLGFWLHQRQKKPTQEGSAATTPPTERSTVKKQFADLMINCDQQNLAEIRRLFILWSCQYWGDPQLKSFNAANEHWQNPTLAAYLTALDNQLYGDKSQPFDSEGFKQQLKQLKPIKSTTTKANSLLPLYPTLSN